MKKVNWIALFVAFMTIGLSIQALASSIPKKKQTTLNLYLTAQQAYEKWQLAPDKVKILDVRTPGEYIFVGHAPMAVNIPVKFLKDTIQPGTASMVMPVNQEFLTQVKERFDKSDTILVMCRSGGRSAAAVNLMAQDGFRNAFNIIDGFEGDKLRMADSYNNGKRLVNGWRNSGAPWTYKLKENLVYTGK